VEGVVERVDVGKENDLFVRMRIDKLFIVFYQKTGD
jgi:hypothetical protein